jgi:hypothetical protein
MTLFFTLIIREWLQIIDGYVEVVFKFEKLNAQSQQRGAVAQGRSLSPYRLWYISHSNSLK